MLSKTTKLHNVGAYVVVEHIIQHKSYHKCSIMVFSVCLATGTGATSLKDEFNW